MAMRHARVRARVTKENEVHSTKDVSGASAQMRSPVLVDCAEYAADALPGVVVKHGGERTTSLACGPIKTSAFGVVRPLSSLDVTSRPRPA